MHLRDISQGMFKIFVLNMTLKIINLKLHPCLQLDNISTIKWNHHMHACLKAAEAIWISGQ